MTSKDLTSQIRVTLGVLAGVAAAGAIAISIVASIRIDQNVVLKQRELVEHALEEQIEAVQQQQKSITVWDDHVIHARNRDQLWLAENVGEWMYDYFGHDRAYVQDEHGNVVHAMRDGKTIQPPAFGGDEETFADITSDLRRRLVHRKEAGDGAEPLSDIAETRVIDIDGTPAIVSVQPIVPSTNRVSVTAGSEYLYISMNLIDEAFAGMIGSHILIKDMRYSEESPEEYADATAPVVASSGETLGYLVWDADRPGITLLKQVLPAGIVALLALGGIALFLGRKLRHASLELHASERRARHLASHDVLTRLPNRAFFEESLDGALDKVSAGEGELALLFLDLDRFKYVNDTLGHRAGDELVRQTAVRLRALAGDRDTVARIGGDEFSLLLPVKNDANEAAIELSDKLLEALAAPFEVDGELLHVSVSIGIAVAPAGSHERQEELLRKADIALYDAKKRGRGCYKVFSDAMGDVLKQRRRVEADLRNALSEGKELRLAYQPLYSDAGIAIGAEALLRWNHPVHNAMSPMLVVSVAEEAGLIMQLGDWILREACKMLARTDLPLMSVNVSPVQLRDEHFAERCLAILREEGIAPQRIQIEVTESVLIETPDLAVKTFEQLRKAGLSIAIDDFGTGYSSMSYLRNYPVDCLKIDRSFVQALSGSDQGRAIVGAMIEMARALKLGVVAEGVETTDQRNVLRSLGCNGMQGYLFSRPLTGEQFLNNLAGKLKISA
ncbi:bifunctional diguanylate cyclase/phosphodiesterase [Nitratireductor sp. ZSWI3]|uniref:putative bifunctional diguanylate cyclase/phosphodiesterase n=1 Tax=Nitratireductor sp. ZSWI3 TaxID=2966359 RepID=UPI00214F9CFE|nr:EAL domain-containing protein [Nitratireductor sp. ZSWI3]MCR4264721.1 EAL domain-containing protein [Nitratireductor sp. ZSWI3]